MQQVIRPLIAFALSLPLLVGCGTTKVMETWQSDQIEPVEPEKVAVLVAWPEQLQRLVIERDIVAQLRDTGVNAVESSELPGMRGELTRENVEVALRNANADAVIIVFIIGGGGGASYERSDYWLDYVGTGVGGYGWYYPRYYEYYDVYTVRQGPGYAEKTTELFLETTYVDVARLQRVWSLVTKSEDIEYQDLAGKLTGKVISQMKKSGQL